MTKVEIAMLKFIKMATMTSFGRRERAEYCSMLKIVAIAIQRRKKTKKRMIRKIKARADLFYNGDKKVDISDGTVDINVDHRDRFGALDLSILQGFFT